MYKGKKIGVSVPAYNEEKLIGRVISTMPLFVDRIIVVDDNSTDLTCKIVSSFFSVYPDRLILICNERNLGAGGATLEGHRRSLAEGMDIMVVMDGDAQMDPDDLPAILEPLVSGRADYVKGNRFEGGEAWKNMPKIRFWGNIGLTLLNKITSGYWNVNDPQSGYTAITREAFEKLELKNIKPGYHFQNDMLVHLNIHNMRVEDVGIKAIYGIGEKSGFTTLWALFSFSRYMAARFFYRINEKYIRHEFHFLVLFYYLGLAAWLAGILSAIGLPILRLMDPAVGRLNDFPFSALFFAVGLLSVVLAILLDQKYTLIHCKARVGQ